MRTYISSAGSYFKRAAKLFSKHETDLSTYIFTGPQEIGKGHQGGVAFFRLTFVSMQKNQINLMIEFRGCANREEEFLSADLDIQFHPDQEHHDGRQHHLYVTSISPYDRSGKPVKVFRSASEEIGISGGVDYKGLKLSANHAQKATAKVVQDAYSLVAGYGVGTPSISWLFKQNQAALQGLDSHYDLTISLSKPISEQYPVKMSYFAAARTTSGTTFCIGSRKKPEVRILQGFNAY